MIKRKSAIQSIDVRDLPEPGAAVLQMMADMLRRKEAETRHPKPRVASEEPLRTVGHVKGNLTRAEIYEDVG